MREKWLKWDSRKLKTDTLFNPYAKIRQIYGCLEVTVRKTQCILSKCTLTDICTEL